MSGWSGHIRVTIGALLGGLLGFYVMHHAEAAYKEKMKEEYVKLRQEKLAQELELAKNSGEILQDS
ncbi:hypothetical protein MARPO_0108s0020 [Marchantia polymorpha]|uniref:Uncharacterized protein n=1 Tax=Marchantia polymorpha TaxID=3197 RepID=A0A2R6WCT9_MARPO|nr:hypothetical protein MARPO_0108s0020 [Marchantia polymorpha]|eukprot:PTQ31672.1 hypothetical protein MARPO_0108s0020 [Marchantia polymorpha]